MLRRAPLYRLLNKVVGWSLRPMGMPPAKETENEGTSLAGLWSPASAGVSLGVKESVLLQPARVRMTAANPVARNRAILRDSLNVNVMAETLERGCGQ